MSQQQKNTKELEKDKMWKHCGLNFCLSKSNNWNENKTFNCAQDCHLLSTTCLKQNLSNFFKSSGWFCSSKMPFVAVEMKAILCNMHKKIWEWSVNNISKASKQGLCLIVFWELKSHFVIEFIDVVSSLSQSKTQHRTKTDTVDEPRVKEQFEMNENKIIH